MLFKRFFKLLVRSSSHAMQKQSARLFCLCSPVRRRPLGSMFPAAFCQYASLPSLWCRHGAKCRTSVSVSVLQRQQMALVSLALRSWRGEVSGGITTLTLMRHYASEFHAQIHHLYNKAELSETGQGGLRLPTLATLTI